VLTRVFETDDEALAWSRDKLAAREAQGWHVIPPAAPDSNVRVV
jgi:hypothetical protein